MLVRKYAEKITESTNVKMPLATFTVTFTSELKKFVVNSVAPDKIEDQLKLFNESTSVEKSRSNCLESSSAHLAIWSTYTGIFTRAVSPISSKDLKISGTTYSVMARRMSTITA